MGNPITTGLAGGRLVSPVQLKKVWDIDENPMYAEQYKEFYDIQKSDRSYEDYQQVTPFGLLKAKRQGGDIEYDSSKAGTQKQIINITYALGFRVTLEMKTYSDKYKLATRYTKALKQSVYNTRNVLGATLFNDGFDSSKASIGDGKAIFATDHPIPASSSVIQNTPSIAADLSPASLKQDFTNIRTVAALDGAGKKIQLRPTRLIVPPALQWDAAEILESTLLADTDNNNKNSVNGVVGYTVFDFLTDDDAYFIKTNHMDEWVWQDSIMVTFDQDNDFDSKDMCMSAVFASGVGAYDPRSMYGNQGA